MGIYSHKKHKQSRQYKQAMAKNDGGEQKSKGWRTPYGFGDFVEPVTYQEACDLMKPIYENFMKETEMPEEYLLQFFKYEHLPDHLQKISKPFGELAKEIVSDLPKNPERTTALRKLLEAKDCAVRANIAA